MNTRQLTVGWIIVGSVALAAGAAPAQTQTDVAPQAERVLAAACQYLAEAPHFSLTAEIWREHVTASGQKLQLSRTVDMEVKRPGGLRLEISSPHSQRGFWYDGKSLRFWTGRATPTAPRPCPAPWMPRWMRRAITRHRPAAQLIWRSATLTRTCAAKVVKVGLLRVVAGAGVDCHHLAFTQENVDSLPFWIEDGPQPLSASSSSRIRTRRERASLPPSLTKVGYDPTHLWLGLRVRAAGWGDEDRECARSNLRPARAAIRSPRRSAPQKNK